ncbi:MAG: transposase family protein, partial [Brevundimonas sp.]|nr:transposase family protein [Brevundimonas sp.]
MIAPQLTPGDVWEYQNVRLTFEQQLGGEILLLRVQNTLAPLHLAAEDGTTALPTLDWFIRAYSEGAITQKRTIESASRARQLALQREEDFAAIDARDPKARCRQFVLQMLDRMPSLSLSEKALGATLQQIWRDHPAETEAWKAPSPRTASRWFQERGTPGQRSLRLMVSLTGQVPRSKRYPQRIWRFLHKCALRYWKSLRVRVRDAFDYFCWGMLRLNRLRRRRGLPDIPHPQKETFRTHLNALECRDTVALRYGVKEANRRFKPVGQGLIAARALMLGAMDSTIIDVHVVVMVGDKWRLLGRPTLTILVDVYSRCVVGWLLTFEPPSLYTALECLKRASLPKIDLQEAHPDVPGLVGIFGKFNEIVTDNGMEFAGVSFQDCLTDIGVGLRLCPIEDPTYKAVVERLFDMLNRLLNQRLPGGTFKPELLRQWGLKPEETAVLNIEGLGKLLGSALAIYHTEPHRTLKEAPLKAWQRSVGLTGVPVIGDPADLEKMAGVVEERQLTTSGIFLSNLQYHDPAVTGPLLERLASFEPRRGQRKGSAVAQLKVKYNPVNMGRVHVWDRTSCTYVTLPCTEPDYAEGLSKWKHDRIEEWLREDQAEDGEERLDRRMRLLRDIDRALATLPGGNRRRQIRLHTSPGTMLPPGSGLVYAEAPPRHDGMAPVVPMTPIASERTDDGARPTRFNRHSGI